MLQTIRDKSSGWVAAVVLGLIILTMAFFGVDSYFSPKIQTYAAKIEGPGKFLGMGGQSREISQDEFRRRLDQARQQQRQQQGEAFDALAFESMDNKRKLLDRLIDEELAMLAAKRDGVGTSSAAVQKAILDIEAFKVEGKFDPDQYRLSLTMQGYTPASFEQLVRDDLARGAISGEIASSGLSGDTELEAYARLSQQTRDLHWLELPTPALPETSPSKDELANWHKSHGDKYSREETVQIEYVELDAASIEQANSVDETTLRQRYEEQKARYVTEPQYVAAHILVAVPANADAKAEASARERALDLVKQARSADADFAQLAQANSDDLGSKADGGSLGAIEKGVYDPAFEKAVFALKTNDVSEPVRGAEGWHVIKLVDLLAGSSKPFEDVRVELEQEYLESEHERAFSDRSGRLIDLVLKDPTALAPAAKELGLPVLASAEFSSSRGEGIAALEPVRRAAFNDAQKLEGQVSDAIDVGSNHIVVLRVIKHTPAAVLPLAQVQDRVLADFNADRLAGLAKSAAEAVLARANKGESLTDLATDLGRGVQTQAAVGRYARDIAPALAAEAFRLAHPKDGASPLGLAKLANDRYALVGVTAVTDGDISKLDKQVRQQMRTQLAQARGSVESRAYLQALRQQYTISVAEDRL